MLIVFGLFLAVADAIGRQTRTLDKLTYKHGILYGLAQALALMPGRLPLRRHHHRRPADGLHARGGGPLFIPAGHPGGLRLRPVPVGQELQDEPGPYGLRETALATVVAFGVGFVIIGWFLKYVSTRSYRLFVWYRIGLGTLLFVLLGFGIINA